MNIKTKSKIVALSLLIAYGVLVSLFTESSIIIFSAEFISGIAIATVAIVLGPLFKQTNGKLSKYFYYPRVFEGIMICFAGIMSLFSGNIFNTIHTSIYQIHTYIFIVTAMIFYILYYQSKLIPRFISIWGMIAIVMLFIINISTLLQITIPYGDILYMPIMANEIFLAVWLIAKGMKTR